MGAGRASQDKDPGIAIIGGGPAGVAAAISARRQGLSAVIVERSETPESPGCAAWLGPAAVRLCREYGVSQGQAEAVELAGLRLWPWTLKECVEVDDPELRGWTVEPRALGRALLEAATAAGAELLKPATVADLQLGEDGVAIGLADGRNLEASFVVIADGAASQSARLARLAPVRARAVAGARAEFEPGGDSGPLDVAIGAGRMLKLAVLARHRSRTRVTFMTQDLTCPATTQLAELLQNGKAVGLVPADAQVTPIETPCLAGAALEVESHVGKRCLLVGDAGGFVAAFSGDGIYPALRSGGRAAEVAARALSADVLQDELATFSTAWRAELADYLRMPNTDLGLLMPMVFGNRRMSERVARAFLLGQAF